MTSRWGGRRKLPLAFTEHGAIKAASVLNSDRAVEISVYVVRAFVQLRAVLLDHKAQPKPANRPIGFTADVTGTPVRR